jgi:FAD/FMN-containing dehydrogenase
MTSASTISIPKLRETFNGRVIAPGEPLYDSARTVFYGGFDRRPAVIIRPANADEVARVVALAAETGLDLAVRSGGHSVAGHSVCDGGIVLDLSDLRAIDIDAEHRTAHAQTGLTAGAYTNATAEHGLATGFGDTGSVGIGGITLGGGVGFLSRKHGLTVDSLLAADVVTADGKQLRVDAENHPDLFWAIRGGGGNFGVATSFTLRLHEVGTVVGGMLMLPATAEVIASFIATAEAAPNELSTIANVMAAPPMPFIPAEAHGQLVLMALMCYAGDVDAGERAIAPFRSLAAPIVDMLKPMPYPQIFMPEEEGYHPIGASRNMFVDRIGEREARVILEHLRASDAAMRVAQLRVLGGAVAEVPADATAYAHRTNRIMVNIAALCQDTDEAARRMPWVQDFAGALDQGDRGAYVGFIAEEGPDRVRAAYPGTTWERLRTIKATYDPTNLFRLNQNIPAGRA